MQKLNQILAVEKNVKARVCSELTKMHHTLQKPAALNGFSKTYIKKDEDSDDFPPENNRVQVIASEMLEEVEKLLTELLDITVTKDTANCHARANVEVDGKIIVEQAPATYLLFVEKQLNDIHTFVSKIPVLDPESDWVYDKNANLYKTAPILTTKTKKVQKPIVLYDATKDHPAQTQLITEDVIVGSWSTVKHSGALPVQRKKKLLDRIEKLIKAVKFAREEANSVETKSLNAGRAIFQYIFGE